MKIILLGTSIGTNQLCRNKLITLGL